jgi:hypothetical protein
MLERASGTVGTDVPQRLPAAVRLGLGESLMHYGPTLIGLAILLAVLADEFVDAPVDALEVGILGVLLLTEVCVAWLFRRVLRFTTFEGAGDANGNYDAVAKAMGDAGWWIRKAPSRAFIVATASRAMERSGQRIEVRFCGSSVLVCSIADPSDISFGVTTLGRNAENVELVRRAVMGGDLLLPTGPWKRRT